MSQSIVNQVLLIHISLLKMSPKCSLNGSSDFPPFLRLTLYWWPSCNSANTSWIFSDVECPRNACTKMTPARVLYYFFIHFGQAVLCCTSLAKQERILLSFLSVSFCMFALFYLFFYFVLHLPDLAAAEVMSVKTFAFRRMQDLFLCSRTQEENSHSCTFFSHEFHDYRRMHSVFHHIRWFVIFIVFFLNLSMINIGLRKKNFHFIQQIDQWWDSSFIKYYQN